MNYDQLVIGNGREAVTAAIRGASDGQSVALLRTSASDSERVDFDLLRDAADQILRSACRSMAAWREEVGRRLAAQRDAETAELARLGIDLYLGPIRFTGQDIVTVGGSRISGQEVILACGTRSLSLASATFDSEVILAVEDLLTILEIPRSMTIIGAGRTGLDYAILLARLGVEITVIDEHSNLFDLCGGLMNGTMFEAQSRNIAFRLGDEVIGVQRRSDRRSAVRLASGRVLTADAALVCIGRAGQTADLGLETVGVGLDERGRVWCDTQGRTWASNISAIGDVIGFRIAQAG